MKEVTTITFEKAEDYYRRGLEDGRKLRLDSSFGLRSEDAWMSYVLGWAAAAAGWAVQHSDKLPKEIKLL